MSLGENIKRLRLEAGLQTQKALADLLGVGVQILQISGTGYPLHDIGGCLPSLVPSQGRGGAPSAITGISSAPPRFGMQS